MAGLKSPEKTPETRAITQWAIDIMAVGHRLVVPAIADYVVGGGVLDVEITIL
jgi:hypothetical protein